MAGQAPQEPPVAEQTIAITGSSTALAQFSGYTAMIRVHCDAICSISIGNSPVATNGTSNTLDGTDIIAAYGGTPAANSTPYEATLNLSMMRLGGMVR